MQCHRALQSVEIALTKKLINRGATRFLCLNCLGKKFGVSKSTVHKDLSERLALCDRALYTQVKAILDENRSQRHIRGGMATRRKYKGI